MTVTYLADLLDAPSFRRAVEKLSHRTRDGHDFPRLHQLGCTRSRAVGIAHEKQMNRVATDDATELTPSARHRRPSVKKAPSMIDLHRRDPKRAKRTSYSAKLKEEALRRLEAGASPSRIARDLGIVNLASRKSAAVKARAK
jgi:hypothetical protein